MLHSFSQSKSLAARTRLGARSRTMPGQFDWLKLATTRTPGARSASTPRTSGVPGRSVSASFSSRVCRQFQPRRALHVFPSEAALQRSHSLLWESASLRHLALLSDETTMAASSIVAAVRRVGILVHRFRHFCGYGSLPSISIFDVIIVYLPYCFTALLGTCGREQNMGDLSSTLHTTACTYLIRFYSHITRPRARKCERRRARQHRAHVVTVNRTLCARATHEITWDMGTTESRSGHRSHCTEVPARP